MRTLLRLALSSLVALTVSEANAATLLVDTTSDDGSGAFQVCDADPGNGDCSLRGAITAANGSAAADSIAFAIPESDAGYQAASQHWRFTPLTQYPAIQGDLAIDGYSQAGAQENTNTPDQGGSNAVLKIELSGPGPMSFPGIYADFSSSAMTVRGVALGNFNFGLQLSGSSKSVEGCFIGTDISGNQARPNRIGIYMSSVAAIGGSSPAQRNVISGNEYIAVWAVFGGDATGLVLAGNLIGSNAGGSAALPGQDYGFYSVGNISNAVLGGSTVAQRNLFAGNEGNAIYISSGGGAFVGTPVAILGNYFGTDWSGTIPLPNGAMSPSQPQSTIYVFKGGACGVRIGGDAAGESNLIAFGAGAGVQIATCIQAQVLGNRFHANRLALDLSATSNADGPTPNDIGDADANLADTGGNRLQNYPDIVDLVPINGGLDWQLRFRVDTAVANASYPLRVDIATGRGGQAEALILSVSIDAIDAQQIQTVTFPSVALTGALVLSATDAAGNSSEFGSDQIFAYDFDR